MTTLTAVLVRPQEHDYDYLQWHEDVALGHLSRELRSDGHRIEVLDYALRPLLTPLEYGAEIDGIASMAPKLIILVIDKHPTNSPYYAGELIRLLRADPRLQDSAHVSVFGNTQVGSERLLDEFDVDSVIVGEERDARALAQALATGREFGDVPGIVYRDRNGVARRNPPLAVHEEFATSKWPDRYYFSIPEANRNPYGYVAAIEGSRGCYAKCTFCYIRTKDSTYGNYAWVGRDPADIVAEMSFLYQDHGAREFSFIDPQFFGPGEKGQLWATDLAHGILAAGLSGISFSIYARANDMKRESLELLKAAGLFAVFIGIESFSDSVLKRYRKGVTARRNLEAIELLMELDIRLRMGFISFDYHTTFAELEESLSGLRYISTLKPQLITQPVFFQNILAPLDDTPVGRQYVEIGAAGLAVTQPSERQLLAKRQERLTRGGPISHFSDPRISFVSDCTRILAAEITARSTRLEIACSESLASGADVVTYSGESLSMGQVLAWFNGLTLFAIEQLGTIISVGEHLGPSEYLDDENEISGLLGRSMRQYDEIYFGHPLMSDVDARSEIVD